MLLITVIIANQQGADSGTSQDDWQQALPGLMEEHNVPGASIAIIEEGKLVHARAFGVIKVDEPDRIDVSTMFSVGSVSKVVTAVAVLDMIEEGRATLDEDINQYLTSWNVPANDYTRQQPVTIERILSHTAGLTVHGFADFQPGQEAPTTVQILNGERPAKNAAIRVDIPVGSQFRYSGGGTTILQLLIEDLSGRPFAESMQANILDPLGMRRSSFVNPLPESYEPIARAHNNAGIATVADPGYEFMPEAAASGLWTTPSDLSLLLIDLYNTHKEAGGVILGRETTERMLTPVSPSEFGLGPIIQFVGDDVIMFHGGANNSYRAHFKLNMSTGNGYVIFTNSRSGGGLIGDFIELLEGFLHG